MAADETTETPPIHFVRVLDDEGWQAVVDIRQQVFVVEQACPPEEEFDAHDRDARHVLGLVEGVPAACARWRVVHHDGAPAAKLERFAVLEAFRGRGYGRPLVNFVIDQARANGHRRFLIHAQAHLDRFYDSLGFVDDGYRFEEAGIPHVRMLRTDG